MVNIQEKQEISTNSSTQVFIYFPCFVHLENLEAKLYGWFFSLFWIVSQPQSWRVTCSLEIRGLRGEEYYWILLFGVLRLFNILS